MSVGAGARGLGGGAHRVALVAAGAARGATALGALLGRDVAARPPVLGEGGLEGEAGVLFDVAGAAAGAVALLFASGGHEAVVAALGAEGAAAESALCEVANIVASQTVSAVADVLAGRITLSIPHLERENAGPRLAARLARAGRVPMISEFAAADGTIRVWLVVAFDPA
jgi:chemotaxis protein CheY-P-specific phosphatase CheC